MRLRNRLAAGYRWLDAPSGGTVAVRLCVIVVAIIGAYAALRVYPAELPASERHPDFLTTIFHSRPIVFTGRVTILCLAAFVVFSIAARMWNREWLSKAGPFEVSTAVSDVEIERDGLKEELAEADEAICRLTLEVERLRVAHESVARMHPHAYNEPEGADHGSQ